MGRQFGVSDSSSESHGSSEEKGQSAVVNLAAIVVIAPEGMNKQPFIKASPSSQSG